MTGPGPLPPGARVRATWRHGRVPHIAALLQAEVVHTGRRVDAVVGWGRKRTGLRAVTLAGELGVPWLLLEDAFLRSVDLGFRSPALAIVVDDIGIYYDATGPSRLELLAAAPHDAAQRERAALYMAAWRAGRVSKYNLAREQPPPVPPGYVLAVDQTAGDSSIAYGLADAVSFHRMLEAALDEHPDATVVLKVHPDVISGRKTGHFKSLTRGAAARVTLLASDAHPPGLIEPARAVYAVTSQMGFEALLWQRPVRVFGMPFYAGWGLTGDEQPAPARRRRIGLEDLAHAALIEYARCLDPETLAPCEPERLLAWMSLQRRQRQRFAPSVLAVGFSRWKWGTTRAFFAGSRVRFAEAGATPAAGETLALWGMTPTPPGPPPGAVVRLEDGFLRSVGLGADLVRPLSWVMDDEGMYYDATRPSALETLLSRTEFDEPLRLRARALRERIVRAGLTKYNVGSAAWRRPPGDRRVVLVPGQVESDASIAHGAPGLRRNLDLLRAARAAAPDAHLVYKPHPDVVAGLRGRGVGEEEAARLCDEIVVDVPMHQLLGQVDALHTLTSLAGFEALLRGVAVVCHGCPFYAGWGLTEDHEAMPRRGRRLTLDELVAGTLILYPTYVSRRTGQFASPESAVDELLVWRDSGEATRWRALAWLRPLVNRWRLWREKSG